MPATPILNLPYPAPSDAPDGAAQIQALAMAVDPLGIVPVGAMMMWAAAAAPSGWLLCDGAVVSATQYPGLAAVLGQTSGNVTLPDMRDRFPIGTGPSTPIAQTGGAASVTLSMAQMPSHSHRADGAGGTGGTTAARDRSQSHTHDGPFPNVWISAVAGIDQATYGGGAGTTTSTDPADHLHAIYANGGGSAHENRPPYRAVNFIIRAG